MSRKLVSPAECLMYSLYFIVNVALPDRHVTRYFIPLPHPPPVVYATDRSKAVVPTLYYSVWLCGLYYGAIHILKASRVLCPGFGKKELVYMLIVHLVVCFARVCLCHFSLPLGVGWTFLFPYLLAYLLYFALFYFILLFLLYSILLYSILRYSTLLYSTLCSTLLYSTLLYFTLIYLV